MPNAKRKGNQFEREVSKILSNQFGTKVKRAIPISGYSEGGDLIGLPFFIECKNFSKIYEGIRKGIRQIYEQNKEGKPWLLISKVPQKSVGESLIIGGFKPYPPPTKSEYSELKKILESYQSSENMGILKMREDNEVMWITKLKNFESYYICFIEPILTQ